MNCRISHTLRTPRLFRFLGRRVAARHARRPRPDRVPGARHGRLARTRRTVRTVGAGLAILATVTGAGADDLAAPKAAAAADITAFGFAPAWSAVDDAAGYELDVYRLDEDFSDGEAASGPVWRGDTNAYEVVAGTVLPGGNASADGFFLASKSTASNALLITDCAETREWRFSLGSPNFDPSDGNYVGVILMASTTIAGDIATANFQGYYLRIGNNGTPDQIRLYRSAGSGKIHEGTFASADYGDGGLQDGIDVRVTRDAEGVWKLWTSPGFTAGADAANYCGAVTQAAYSASSYFGVFTHIGNTGTSRRVFIDNIELGAREYAVGYEAMPTSDPFASVTGLVALTDYAYLVRATNAVSVSTNSNTVALRTLPPTVTTTAPSDAAPGGFTANWNSLPSATGYRLDVFRANDDFTDGSFTTSPAWDGDTGVFEVLDAAVLPGGQAATDGHFLAGSIGIGAAILTTPSTETSEWRFSLGTPDFNPSSQNHFGVVLMSNTAIAGDINDAVFQGYYLRIGDDGDDPIRLYRSTGVGKEWEGSFARSSFSVGALRDGINVRVTRSVGGVWELWTSPGFTYAADASTYRGAVTQATYTASSHFGIYTRFNYPAASRRIYLDNVCFGSALRFAAGFENLAIDAASHSRAAVGLLSGMDYFYRVRGITDTGVTGNSALMSATTKARGAVFCFF